MKKVPGDLYLVILIHTTDDMPLHLFSDLKEAQEYAAKVDPMPTKEIRELFCTDAATPICVEIYQFSGGVPTRPVYFRAFD